MKTKQEMVTVITNLVYDKASITFFFLSLTLFEMEVMKFYICISDKKRGNGNAVNVTFMINQPDLVSFLTYTSRC